MATYRSNVGIRWGMQSLASTAFANALMLSSDSEKKGDEFEARDGAGEVKAWYGYNQFREATFTMYVSSASPVTSASVVAPGFGELITVTGGSEVSGSTWIVKSVMANASNQDATKLVIKATEYTGNITA